MQYPELVSMITVIFSNCIQHVIKDAKTPCCPLCKEAITKRSLNTRSSHEKFVQVVKDVELAFQQDLDELQTETTNKKVRKNSSQTDSTITRGNDKRSNSKQITRTTSMDSGNNKIYPDNKQSQNSQLSSKSRSMPCQNLHSHTSTDRKDGKSESQNGGETILHSGLSENTTVVSQDKVRFELIKSKRKLASKSIRHGFDKRTSGLSSSFDNACTSNDSIDNFSSKRSDRNNDNVKLTAKNMQTIDSWLRKDINSQVPSQKNDKGELEKTVNKMVERSLIGNHGTIYLARDKADPTWELYSSITDVTSPSQKCNPMENQEESRSSTKHPINLASSFIVALTDSQKLRNSKSEVGACVKKSEDWIDLIEKDMQQINTNNNSQHSEENEKIISKSLSKDGEGLTTQLDLNTLTPEMKSSSQNYQEQKHHSDLKTSIKSNQIANNSNTTPKRFFAGSITRAMQKWKDSSANRTPNTNHVKARLRRLNIRRRNDRLATEHIKIDSSMLSVQQEAPKVALMSTSNGDNNSDSNKISSSASSQKRKTSPSATPIQIAQEKFDSSSNATHDCGKSNHCIPKMGICHSESISSDGDSARNIGGKLYIPDSISSSSMETTCEGTPHSHNLNHALSQENLNSDQALPEAPTNSQESLINRVKIVQPTKTPSKRVSLESSFPDRPRKKHTALPVDIAKIEGTFKVPHHRAQSTTKCQNIKITTEDSIANYDHQSTSVKDTDQNLTSVLDNQFIENSESMPLFLSNSDALVPRHKTYNIDHGHTKSQDIKGSSESNHYCGELTSKYKNLIPGGDGRKEADIFVSPDSDLMDYPFNKYQQREAIQTSDSKYSTEKDYKSETINFVPDPALEPSASDENNTNSYILKQNYVVPNSEELMRQLESSKIHDDNNTDNPESIDSQVLENIRVKMNEEKERIARMKSLLDAALPTTSSQSPRKSDSSLASDLTCTVMPISTQPYMIDSESDDHVASDSDDTHSLESMDGDRDLKVEKKSDNNVLLWSALDKPDDPDEDSKIENTFQESRNLQPGTGSVRVLAEQTNASDAIGSARVAKNENLNYKRMGVDRSRHSDFHKNHHLSSDVLTSNISLVATGLLDKEKHKVALLAKLFNAKFAREINRTTTHVIVKAGVLIADENNLAECTVKYFQGIAAGLCLVNFQWVLECISWNTLIPTEMYEIKGSTNSNTRRNELGAPRRSRLARLSKKPRLFDGYSFCCWGQFYSIAKGQLRRVLEFAGAKVIEESSARSDKVVVYVSFCVLRFATL
ncbi:uncharacterized protein TRIADDRAFT_54061 [Trichoplax adhaerens]|uniref:BRCT domain-containing protein n=1 Tax=Trichoplax adhaerens TaxID=10228 RepID=B3RR01_TRIAD|nr:hypothetical protein TRIADDRAFT_54061 [Trichoplax adhaerens]EDV26257.1 hypothetical protein TRIADDRAFT_54061 [Trichoplax adhaerens]|eukprot:XP_002110253.1 hypothetical protein TRIADDRAFT_54061 [Trichoplax adhaerens]